MSPFTIQQISPEFLKQVPFPSFLLNREGVVLHVNDACEKLIGFSEHHLQEQPIQSTFFSTAPPRFLELIMDSKDSLRFNELQLSHKDDHLVSVSLLTKPCVVLGKPVILCMMIPTENSQLVDRSHQNLVDFYNGIHQSFMTVTIDHEGFIIHCNSDFLKTSQWTPKRVLGKTIWHLFPSADGDNKIVKAIWKTLQNRQIWQGDVEKVTKNGQPYWVHLTAIPTFGATPADTQYIFIEKDITADKKIQLQLEKIAYIDTETGLMNTHRLEHVITDMIEEQRHFSFVYLSIDKFYTLKELHANTEESSLIIDFTKRLKMYFQDSTMARINENDFVVITPLPEWFIQGFQTYLQQNPIYNNHSAVPLSISGGITRFPEDQHSFTQLMKASLATIATVREAGGNQIIALSKTTHTALNRKALIEKRLLLALNQQNLKVLYQPQLNLKTGKISAVEALVRWDDEEVGVIAPHELIPIAEETGLINRIGSYVIEQACQQAVIWQKAGFDLTISINSSVREFRDKNMAKSILQTLERTGCPAHLIQIEITEKFALEAEAETSIIKQMRQLENEGITFALDDFGTGYASFRYMQLLPIEILKIDQTYISSLLQSEKTKRLIDGMIHFGQSMNLTVIAEGVETAEQKELLTSYGCDAIQGFYVSKPAEAREIEKLYQA